MPAIDEPSFGSGSALASGWHFGKPYDVTGWYRKLFPEPETILPAIAPDPAYCAVCSNLVTGNRVYHSAEHCPKGPNREVIRSAREVLEAAGYVVIAPLETVAP